MANTQAATEEARSPQRTSWIRIPHPRTGVSWEAVQHTQANQGVNPAEPRVHAPPNREAVPPSEGPPVRPAPVRSLSG